MHRRLKVLVSAYACEPNRGSEPGVGWNWAKQIAKFAEVWVITRTNNQDVIDEALRQTPEPSLHFTYVDIPRWARFWKKRQTGVHFYYMLWQLLVYFRARELDSVLNFDLSHHVTFGVYSAPGAVAFLPFPFIWGPLGGVDTVPKLSMRVLGVRGSVYELLRGIYHNTRFRYDPFVRMTFSRARAIICRTSQTNAFLQKFTCSKQLMTMIETGSPHITSPHRVFRNPHICFTVFSVGRLIPWKGFYLTVKAYARFSRSYHASLLEIAGDGYDIRRLTKLVEKDGVLHRVRFLGQIHRSEVMMKLEDCDVFIYTSLREGGAWVIMEAMAAGKPIICLNHSGVGEMVADECGIKVEPKNHVQIINDLAHALLKLATEPELRIKMGEAGRKRVMEHYTWEKKGAFIRKVYEDVLGRKIGVDV